MKIDFSKAKTMGEIIDVFNKLDDEEDFKNFYLEYAKVIESTINEECKLKPGDNREVDLVRKRLHSNLNHLLGDTSQMRKDYALKVWWFLNL